ncbi:methyltransferase domain-containing protein [Psychroserpens burtonensis]|uniref:Methyltransferase domain-containing protein n=1 Tax=Psychroserpens burtonensis TaxID=49278 RepID=A0A5C7B5U0_9FLAO|nr:methyltransferase domain-containing protein [Psychroserpens burtonensis]TXE17131.1 methyltransferase domain-containing protein [Psychroserpens burtonensis]
MNLLNLGCGSAFHKDWINLDFVSNSDAVQAHNLLEGIPFEHNSMDAVYHSHVLEHFSKVDGYKFIQECYRVLKPQGVIRIAVPDLEIIAREYLKNLEQALSGNEEAKNNYRWIVLELFDQMIRNKSGGNMKSYLYQETIPNESYVFERIGMEGKKIRRLFLKSQQTTTNTETKKASFFKRIKHKSKNVFNLGRINQSSSKLSKSEKSALEIGRFRLKGEIHQWMYDRYSLSEILKTVGFENIKISTAFDSTIPNWEKFELDVIQGEIRKPDSLFIEAQKL